MSVDFRRIDEELLDEIEQIEGAKNFNHDKNKN